MIASANLWTPPGAPSCHETVGARSAAGSAVLGTALAATGHHLVLGGTTSLRAVVTVTLALFTGGLLRAPGVRSFPRDLTVFLFGQAAACSWFALRSPQADSTDAFFHGGPGPGGAVYAALALITACALRAAAFAGSRWPVRFQTILRVLARSFRAVLSARATLGDATAAAASTVPARAGDERIVIEVLPTGSTGRRGPP
ncbi:hypothetical protein ACFYOA_22705 [Streptomyces iakyrus]|uniref:hypothetical protein n=1 Tax=Streptomyces iakyrus TaxID=68219 RepID=UPI0036B87AB7